MEYMLKADDLVGVSFWIISVAMVASTAFFFLEGNSVAKHWQTSVRVAGLKELVRENLSRISIDDLSPQEQIEKIEKLTRSLIEKQQIIWKGLLSELKKSGICILSNKDLLISDLKSLEKYFTDQVFPLITPLAIDEPFFVKWETLANSNFLCVR